MRVLLALPLLWATGCTTPRPGALLKRQGDEIVVAGQLFHTGTHVVTWMDPNGYDAYRTERRFAPFDQSSWETSKVAVAALKTPNRFGLRKDGLNDTQVEKVRGGGWDLPLLRDQVDQFVLHFDAAGTSRQCFKVLHDNRCLSVHFMLDLDGTIYQTLDLKERAWHATTSNTRSIGIEIANIGAFAPGEQKMFEEWYQRDDTGWPRVVMPARFGEAGLLTPNFIARPARKDPVVGPVQGRQLQQYDFTPQQYAALVKLTATLCKVFPKIRCDYPRGSDGRLFTSKLPDEALDKYRGILGHYHIQTNKVDPGPAFQWERVIGEANKLLK
ncbi:MAG: N-acetylmuramoyl-L-alanine amidase [Proteobacteria bacterium]|nr:N-acetylmuramoyl-L-alanine amidase [Pseudomonadota bacterium]